MAGIWDMLALGNTQGVPPPGTPPPPTQAQMNAYFTNPGSNPWMQVGPPRSAMGIPDNQSASGATSDQLDQLAGVLKAKQAQEASGGGQPPAGGLPPPVAPPQPMSPAMMPTAPVAGGGGQYNAPRGGQSSDIQNQLDQASIDALKTQGLSVDQMKARLADMQGKALPTDFRPAAALVDSWTGSHLSQAATPSETAQQRQAAISQLQEAVLKGEQGMSSDQLSMLKTKLNAQYHEDDIQERAKDRQVQRDQTALFREQMMADKNKKFDAGEFDKAAKGFTSDPPVVDLMKKRDEISAAKSQIALAQTNPLVYNTLPMTIVRLYVNRVSKPELDSAGGEKDLLGRAAQFAEEMKSGTISAANAKFMQGLVESLEKTNNASLQGHIERHADMYARVSGLPKDQAAEAVSGGLYGKVASPAAAGAPPPPKVGDVVDGHKYVGGDPSKPAAWVAQ